MLPRVAAAALLLPVLAGAQCIGEPVEHVVPPATTDPAIDADLEDHYAYLQPALAATRGELVVWFSGSCGQPRRQRRLLREAARAGYHTIGLNYPNCPSVNGLCDPLQPGAPDCYEEVRLERLDGIDRSPLVTVSPPNGIVNRLVKLLEYLAVQFPSEGWDQYLDGGAPRWERLVVAGHSQGGGMAAIIGKEHEVARVAMFSWKDTITPLQPAPWLFAPKATPVDRYVGFSHQHSAPIPEEVAWNALGLPGVTVNVDITPEPYGNANRLTTDVLPQTGSYDDAHGSVATDQNTPLRADGTPVLSEVWRYLLGATPLAVTPVRATKLVLKDGSATADPRRRKIAFTAKTKHDVAASRIVVPAPDGPGDPRIAGAVLEVFNAQVGVETARVVLPPAGWRLLGPALDPKGWAFTSATTGDPIRKVTLKGDSLVVKGGKAAWCYTLDEPAQGRVGVRLAMGDGAEWCADVPAKASGTPPTTARHDTVDRFTGAPKTPPPAACPLAPRLPLPASPSGAFLEVDRS
jgi:hypothetical protein